MEWSCKELDKTEQLSLYHMGLIPGLGRSPGEGKGYPLQYSGLENSMECMLLLLLLSRLSRVRLGATS